MVYNGRREGYGWVDLQTNKKVEKEEKKFGGFQTEFWLPDAVLVQFSFVFTENPQKKKKLIVYSKKTDPWQP